MFVIGWRYPSIEWVKLNVDSCSRGNPGCAGAGGLIRESMGSWIKGFAINTGICSSVRAEFWAAITGLELAWDLGLHQIILESDSVLTVNLINYQPKYQGRCELCFGC
ncbi:hypothetical protein Peur_020095 [Populus x canadensis]